MNNTTVVVPVISQAEILSCMLPVLPLATIGIVVNGLIIRMYARFVTLRAVGGIHVMMLLAAFDMLGSIA